MVVMLPNPVLDPGAAHAAETTVGGSGMLRFISTKGREASVTVMKRKVIIFIWMVFEVMRFTKHMAHFYPIVFYLFIY